VQIASQPHDCKAHPDEKGTERNATIKVSPLTAEIARPIPMKRELKESTDTAFLMPPGTIARPIPMKRELKDSLSLNFLHAKIALQGPSR